MKKFFLMNFALILLIFPTGLQARSLTALEARYTFLEKKNSYGLSCSIQIVVSDRDLTNAFGLEFGVQGDWQRNKIQTFLYFDWHDVYTVNGVLQRQSKKVIRSASISNRSYNSDGKFESFSQKNGELWQFSQNTNGISDIFALLTSGPYKLTYLGAASNERYSIEIKNLIPKTEFGKFLECHRKQIGS